MLHVPCPGGKPDSPDSGRTCVIRKDCLSLHLFPYNRFPPTILHIDGKHILIDKSNGFLRDQKKKKTEIKNREIGPWTSFG